MPTFGPWITPPPVTTSGALPLDDSVFTRQLGRAMSSFVAACETPDVISRNNGLFLAYGNGISLPWFCGQIPVAVALDALDGLLSDYSPTLPPGVSGVDYDPAQPAGPDWVTSDITYTIPFRRYEVSSAADFVDYPFTVRQVDASTLTQTNAWPIAGVDPGLWQPPDQVDAWRSGSALSGLTALATIHMPTTYSLDEGGDFSADYTGDVTVPRASYWTDTLGRQWAVVVLHFPQQISHVAPVFGDLVDNRIRSSATTSPTSDDYMEGVALSATFTYQPRRYRFIRSVLPPLRQFPRDDALGGAPRQGKTNGPTSVQGSTRQGWRGTYR